MTTAFATMTSRADRDGAEDLRTGTDRHSVAERGVAFAGGARPSAESHTEVEHHVIADHTGLADHDAMP